MMDRVLFWKRKRMRSARVLSVVLVGLSTTRGCGSGATAPDEARATVVGAVDMLAAELAADRPADAAAYAERLRA